MMRTFQGTMLIPAVLPLVAPLADRLCAGKRKPDYCCAGSRMAKCPTPS
jgi:hypothetical protein